MTAGGRPVSAGWRALITRGRKEKNDDARVPRIRTAILRRGDRAASRRRRWAQRRRVDLRTPHACSARVDGRPAMTSPSEVMPPDGRELFTIPGVEIFRAGKWN